MANGRQHSRANYTALVVLAAVAVVLGLLGHMAPFYAFLGGMGAFIAGPDLDVEGVTEDEARWYRISPLLGLAFHLYWLPYSLIPHRSIWSHLPGLASALRMAYALAIPGAWWLHVGWPVPWWALGWAWVGWSVIDTVHLALDGWQLFD
jgi:uncharacterized metal-binding protein